MHELNTWNWFNTQLIQGQGQWNKGYNVGSNDKWKQMHWTMTRRKVADILIKRQTRFSLPPCNCETTSAIVRNDMKSKLINLIIYHEDCGHTPTVTRQDKVVFIVKSKQWLQAHARARQCSCCCLQVQTVPRNTTNTWPAKCFLTEKGGSKKKKKKSQKRGHNHHMASTLVDRT